MSEYTQTHLKKRRDNTDQRRKERATRLAFRRQSAAPKRETFHRAEKFVSTARRKAKSLKRLVRRTKALGDKDTIPDGHQGKIYFVVRLVGTYALDPHVRRLLTILRLRTENSGSFVRVNKTTTKILNMVSQYVTWGLPSIKTITELLHKRGHATIRGSVRALTSNVDIEKALGKHGIICLDDVVHEIVTCGSNFQVVNKWLEPFKLHRPPGGWPQRFLPHSKGGQSGDRGEEINDLLAKMI